MAHFYHEYYWRFLFARYGAYRSVHSWEMANESSTSGNVWRMGSELASAAVLDGKRLANSARWAVEENLFLNL